MRRTHYALSRWLLGLVLVGCSAQGGPGTPTACSPGASASCLCASGGSGTQTCGADMTFGACVCGGGDASAMDAPTDMTIPQPDLPVSMDLSPVRDSGQPDVAPPRDVPSAQDRPMSFDVPASDRSMGGVCPSSCSFNSDCDPCWGAGETRIGSYCCMSGLCVYASDRCGSSSPDGGMMTLPETGVPDASFDIGG